MKYVTKNKRDNAANKRSYKGRLLQCAAASAAAWVIGSSPAHAAIPPECDEEANPNIVTCVVAAPAELEQVDVTQDNTSILIGDGGTPTRLNTQAGDGVVLTGNGAQAVVIGPNSNVLAENGSGITLTGSGVLAVVTGDGVVINGGNGAGIETTSDGAINLNLGGRISGSGAGVQAVSNGDGDVVINANGTISSSNATGMFAIHTGNGDLDVDVSDAVIDGAAFGISSTHNGSGSVSLVTGDVTGNGGSGIALITAGTVDDVTLDTTAGAVSGTLNGIDLLNDSTDASVTISTADVSGQNADGLSATSFGVNMRVDTSDGIVMGGENGLDIRNSGTGSTLIRTADVSGDTDRGIRVETGADTTDLVIDTAAGSVQGGVSGLFASHEGSGVFQITTGEVLGFGGSGLVANVLNAEGGLDLDTTAGLVAGEEAGLAVFDVGSADTSIRTGNVTGVTGDGIRINAQSGSFEIDSSAGNVFGGEDGIQAVQIGTGGVSIVSGSVVGETGFGIIAGTGVLGTSLSIDSRGGSVTGATGGVSATNAGSSSVSVATADVTAVDGDGISAFNANGDGLFVDSSAGSVMAGGRGIVADNAGFGVLQVTTADVTGVAGAGIVAINNPVAQSIRIDSTAGTVSGGTNGIEATSAGNGPLTILTGNVTGENGDGITALNSVGGFVQIDTRNGSVIGSQTGIDVTNLASGSLVIQTANVTGQGGAGTSAIFASNGAGGEVGIATSDGVVTGHSGITALQGAASGLSVTTGDVTGTGDYGIRVRTNSADSTQASVDSTNGAIRAATDGIDANHAGTGALTVFAGDVTALGGTGILASNDINGSDVRVDSRAGAVFGGTVGIQAANLGSGALSVSTADVRGDGGDGVAVGNSAAGTDLNIDTIAGDVSGTSDGIAALNLGTGALSIRTANVMGEGAEGIEASNGPDGTDLIIDSSAGAVIGQEFGIAAFNEGSGVTSVVTADVNGVDDEGIAVANTANGTSLMIDTRAGAVTGGQNGIDAINNGSSSASIVTGDVTGTVENGITLQNNGLEAFIDTTGGTVAGREGIAARNTNGSLTILTADVNGLENAGVRADNEVGSTFLTVNTSAGSVTAGDAGITADNEGSGALTITTADVTSMNTTAVNARNFAAGTDLIIDTTAGQITANFTGIAAANNGTGDLAITTAGVISNDGTAINANHFGAGDFVIDSTAGAVAGAFDGLNIDNLGTGDLMITTADVIGTMDEGISVVSGAAGGDVVVDTSAGIVMAGDDGILAIQDGTGLLSITTGDVSAANNAVVIEAAGGQTSIVNQGTIESGGFEVFATANSTGSISVVNNGAITGNISLGSGADEVTNNGVFNAIGNSLFDTGNDLFANLGRVSVTGPVTFGGLDTFNNSGTISLANGVLGDRFELAGDYQGLGGRLELDVNLTGVGETDTLVVDNAATGSTAIALSFDGQQVAFGNSTLLVDAGAGTSADAFALEGGNVVSQGFVSLALSFDATNNDFLLNSAVGPAVFRTLKIAEGAQSAWYRSADAWNAHVDSKRHSAEVERRPIWGQIYGSTSSRDDRFDFTSGGFTQDIVLDYNQDFFGFQLGAEFGPGSAGDNLYYGVTAGYLTSDLGFAGLADSVRYDAFNLGVYAGYEKDGLFAHGLVKYDFIKADIDGQSVGYTAETDGGSIGFRAAAGYRWDSGSFFLEPSVGLEYQSTNLDDFSALDANFDLGNVDGLRGQAGVRFGSESELKGGSTLTYYASVKTVHEFAGDGEVTFSTPLASATLVNNPIDTYARIDLGLNIATKGGVTGFIEGNADLSGDYSSFGGRAGLRIAF